MNYPVISPESRFQRLHLPANKKLRMVLDTDTFNEIDDQFAVVYALNSPERLQVEALYAAPFFNDLSTCPKDGMEKSYDEILRILKRLGRSPENFVYKGSTQYLPGADVPVHSEAAVNLVERAMASSEDDPLYVVAIGAITNVASAILLEPKIIDKIVVVWLGGHALHWPHTKEFNLHQDLHASRLLFDCGVPLILIPCAGVASHLTTTLSEIEDFVKGQGEIGDYLYEVYKNCNSDHFAYSRVIWDISTIAFLINDKWIPAELTASPVLTDQFTWSVDKSRHFIRCAYMAHRDPVFRDLFQKLRDK